MWELQQTTHDLRTNSKIVRTTTFRKAFLIFLRREFTLLQNQKGRELE